MIPVLPSWNELQLVMPEIWLAIGMCAVLTAPLISRKNITAQAAITLSALLLALLSSLLSLSHADAFVFSGMLAIDPFSQFFKIMLMVFTMLVVLLWMIGPRKDTPAYDTPDFLCLILGATFGMSLMASANNLLMILIAVESASLPSFALAGFRKLSRSGSEGALKYVVFGSASSAIGVYGMSLIYGSVGSLALADIASHASVGISPLMAVGLLAMFAGIAFKLSAVPMHFWCPDVFEGAPLEVTTFLSVASKGAAICLLVRVLYTFSSFAAPGESFTGIATGIAILGGVTATWGNLVALHQTQIKRLLAYSSIAHAGYMIMGASVIALASPDGVAAELVTSAVLFYLMVYLFMNLGAFTVASVISHRAGTEDIREYAGMIRRSPVLTVFLTAFMLSLFGMPGLGGFLGKIFLMKAMSLAGVAAFALIGVLLINTLLSLWYYMRPTFYMVLSPDTKNRPNVAPQAAAVALLAVCGIALIWTGLDLHASTLTQQFATIKRPAPVTALVQPVLPPQAAATDQVMPPVHVTESQ